MARRIVVVTAIVVLVGSTSCTGGCSFGRAADCAGADLSGQDLSGRDGYAADLSGANLSGADLSRADLGGADLSSANLADANLTGAVLSGANLSNADLSGADLTDVEAGIGESGAAAHPARLSDADLVGSDLTGARFDDADLSGANLTGAIVDSASFARADLTGAVLEDVVVPDDLPELVGARGISDEALAALVGVALADLSRTLSERGLLLEPGIDASPACAGAAVPGAGTSHSEGFHATVHPADPELLPAEFAPVAVRFLELAACTNVLEPVEQTRACGPYSDGSFLTLFRERLEVRIVDARTSEEIADRVFTAPAEGACPPMKTSASVTVRVSPEEVVRFVRPFVFAD